MKKLIGIFVVLAVVLSLSSCTENIRARNFGGEASLTLPADQKLVVVTWKDNDLWYLTKPMTEDDVAETYTFSEESSWGVWEGTYTIKEVKTKKK